MSELFISTIALCITLLSMCFSACHQNSTEPNSTNNYQYTAYNPAGTAVVEGSLSLEFKDAVHITGGWHLFKIGNDENIGPQVGFGELTGTVENGNLYINLNPKFVDNNVFLTGTIVQDTIRGTWTWETFAGATARGAFKASKAYFTIRNQ